MAFRGNALSLGLYMYEESFCQNDFDNSEVDGHFVVWNVSELTHLEAQFAGLCTHLSALHSLKIDPPS